MASSCSLHCCSGPTLPSTAPYAAATTQLQAAACPSTSRQMTYASSCLSSYSIDASCLPPFGIYNFQALRASSGPTQYEPASALLRSTFSELLRAPID